MIPAHRTLALFLALAALAAIAAPAHAQPVPAASTTPSAPTAPAASTTPSTPTTSTSATPSASAAPAPSAGAKAGPSQEDRDRANTLMDEGDERIEKGELAAALEAYQKAHALMRVPTTGIEIAKTLDKLGKLTAALAAAREVAESPPSAGEPAPFATAREQAKTLVADLETRVPTLTITVVIATAGARADISLDGRRLPPGAVAAPMQLDPGRYRVTAAAPEHTAASVEISLKERDRGQVALALARASAPPPLPTRTPPPPPPPALSPFIPAGFSIAGLGVLGGALTGALAISAASEANSLCPGGACRTLTDRDRAQARYNLADALAVSADISFALALAGLAIGIYGVAATPTVSPPGTPAPASSAAVFVGPGSASFRLKF